MCGLSVPLGPRLFPFTTSSVPPPLWKTLGALEHVTSGLASWWPAVASRSSPHSGLAGSFHLPAVPWLCPLSVSNPCVYLQSGQSPSGTECGNELLLLQAPHLCTCFGTLFTRCNLSGGGELGELPP